MIAKDKIKDFQRRNPKATHQETMDRLNLVQSTYYRALRQLKKEALDPVNSNFRIPDNIVKGILPPTNYKYTHLAAYLAQFENSDRVFPYEKSKAEIMFAVKKKFTDDNEAAMDLVYGLQERLAIYALFTGDVSPFKKTIGIITQPDLKEI